MFEVERSDRGGNFQSGRKKMNVLPRKPSSLTCEKSRSCSVSPETVLFYDLFAQAMLGRCELHFSVILFFMGAPGWKMGGFAPEGEKPDSLGR
jgi:hypothetical protein